MLTIIFLNQPEKFLGKLYKKNKKLVQQISKKIQELSLDPTPLTSKAIVNYSPYRRIRVDKYRIVYYFDKKNLYIDLIEKRDKVYKKNEVLVIMDDKNEIYKGFLEDEIIKSNDDLYDDITKLFHEISSCWQSLVQSIEIINEYFKNISVNKETDKFKFFTINISNDYLVDKAKKDVIFQLDNFRVIFIKFYQRFEKVKKYKKDILNIKKEFEQKFVVVEKDKNGEEKRRELITIFRHFHHHIIERILMESIKKDKIKFEKGKEYKKYKKDISKICEDLKQNKDINKDIIKKFRKFFYHIIERTLKDVKKDQICKIIPKRNIVFFGTLRYDVNKNNIFLGITDCDGENIEININDIINPLFESIKRLVGIFKWSEPSHLFIQKPQSYN